MGLLTSINTWLGRGTWPPPGVRGVWEDIELHAALRTSEDTRLRQERSIAWNLPYLITPVPRMLSRASANLLYGEPAEFKQESDSDHENLDRIADENELDSEAHRMAVISSSEGEVWGRIVVAPDLLDVPIIEFVSRGRVIPHFRGRFVIGATFVTTWATSGTERVRLLETYEAGAVTCQLFRGGTTTLGMEIALDSFDETKGRQEQVLTGIDWPLVAFIPNSIDSDPARGFSDYRGLENRFLAVNEAETVGQSNLKLAGKKRALVDGKYLDNRGNLPTDADLLINKDGVMGEAGKAFQLLEYSFEAQQLNAWVDHLIDTTLQLAGYSPQSVGRLVEGGAVSGTALKLKMAHTLMESSGKGRYADRGLRRLLRAAQIIDGRPTTQGGFGRKYEDADTAPSVERSDGLPRDDTEAAQQLVALTQSESISLEQRVAFLHPDWSQERIDEEVTALKGEQAQVSAGTGIETERPQITVTT